MADEELAPEGGEALELAPETETIDETPEPIANLAREMGWAPKEEFHGDPEKWKPADQFIRDGRDIQRTMADRLKGLESQIERFGRISEQIVSDKVSERDAYWQEQFGKAIDEGDREAADRARKELQKLETQPQTQAPPELASWMAKNTWYNTDPAAQVRAQEIADRLAKQGKTPAEQLEAAEKIVRREFPEHFPQPKQPPATNGSGARTAAPSNRAKGFADMPAESQRMAKDMAARNPSVTVEDIAKSYWADVAKQRRA